MSEQKRVRKGLPIAGAGRQYTRREVITKVAATTGASLATIGIGAWLLGRPQRPVEEEHGVIADHRIARSPGSADIVVVRGTDSTGMVRRGLEAMGGMGAFVRPGEKVCIKPNVGWNRLPAQGANTDPAIVEEVVRQVIGAGAKEVWVADVPVNNPERCFSRSGIAEAAHRGGAEVIMPRDGAFRLVQVGGDLLRVAEVLWPFAEADRIINLPVVKQHGLCRATMAMKNWYGVLGGHRVRLHQDIDRSIYELAAMMRPTLTVMDATRVMLANGPSGGSLDDIKRFDTIALGVDEVALDAWGSQFLGVRPEELGFVRIGAEQKLGRSDWRALKVVEI